MRRNRRGQTRQNNSKFFPPEGLGGVNYYAIDWLGGVLCARGLGAVSALASSRRVSCGGGSDQIMFLLFWGFVCLALLCVVVGGDFNKRRSVVSWCVGGKSARCTKCHVCVGGEGDGLVSSRIIFF